MTWMGTGSADSCLRRQASSPKRGNLCRLDRLFPPVDIASLIYFRIAFGGLMIWEITKYRMAHAENPVWNTAEFHFKYYGFGWVPAPGPEGMQLLYWILLVCAAGILFGIFYRFCALVFAVGFTWLFLMDAAQYLNHFYLICLISFLAVLLPANRRLAVDSFRNPGHRSDTAPAWCLWLLRAQVAIVYFFGGIAKLNADWLRGEPVRMWLNSRAEGSSLAEWMRTEWTVGLICHGGLVFDLLVVPLLLWRRTRPFAFALAIAFHLTNNWWFNIGIFPWLAIAVTALFFDPSWPRRFLSAAFRILGIRAKVPPFVPSHCAITGVGHRRLVALFLVLFLTWQLLMPLRHLLYPGPVSWTEEGHRFSWHMKLRSKVGDTTFVLLDPVTREVWTVNSLTYLTPRQQQKMSGHPDMIIQFAHYLAELMASKGRTNMHVHAIAHAQLNGRKPALLIDPDINLAATTRSLRPAHWIQPLDNNRPDPSWFIQEAERRR